MATTNTDVIRVAVVEDKVAFRRGLGAIFELTPGIDCVGMGSDYDYIVAPKEIATAAKLPNLVGALRAAGFDGEDLEKLLYKNWIRVLRETWGE